MRASGLNAWAVFQLVRLEVQTPFLAPTFPGTRREVLLVVRPATAREQERTQRLCGQQYRSVSELHRRPSLRNAACPAKSHPKKDEGPLRRSCLDRLRTCRLSHVLTAIGHGN